MRKWLDNKEKEVEKIKVNFLKFSPTYQRL